MLHQRNRRGGAAGAAVLALLGALFAAAGAVMASQGGSTVVAGVVALVFGAALLALAGLALRGRGVPDRLALTPDGVRVSRGDETFLLPAAAIRSFGMVPVKGVRALDVRFDPAAAPAVPAHVARLRTAAGPGELRLIVVGERPPFASPALAERAHEYVARHGLGDWDDAAG
ncbi:hypothetical protein F8568_041040 [Actinomadura sp. LD22]|uniref:PH domain-containing protein n=1 Tax=Actinomadura physcomitrii TaxID=2650748 RepID=A0A6I4MK87_9ACTN|nr:hypothetical protein [Actinomadura physcomitrii]MWA06628.1 hypothetical protein [Actinomadura physcomitrii]